jgi:hypothetical protein
LRLINISHNKVKQGEGEGEGEREKESEGQIIYISFI